MKNLDGAILREKRHLENFSVYSKYWMESKNSICRQELFLLKFYIDTIQSAQK